MFARVDDDAAISIKYDTASRMVWTPTEGVKEVEDVLPDRRLGWHGT